ncbi:Myb family transcription factor family protein [Striga asiatica]|uniref:Myb family transcription factor family protein n=1 Tax=Striga asiatica TaxID=4170 RepID=A0A5A7P0Y3_STRAF|nr:Myb family transcription factor family protein [Striga asiatica]
MVSVYPNPPPDRDFTHFYGLHMGGGPMKIPGLNGNENSLLQTAPVGNLGPGVDDTSKKIRKPYTITKSRESWSDQEHDKFVEALHLFDRDWKKIEAFVGSKTVIQVVPSHLLKRAKRVNVLQIRSHAQKYFLKVQKNGTSEHVPPPRPKRKAAHPYPQKASKNAVSQATGPLQSSAALVESGYCVGSDSLSISGNPMSSAPLSSWNYNVMAAGILPHTSKDDIGLASATNKYSSGSNENNSSVEKLNEMRCAMKPCNNASRVMPDFAQVYRFIGSVFDPTASDHLQRLKTMDPINVETAVMLMKNLSVNLVSPEFEHHRKLLSSNCGFQSNVVVRNKIPSKPRKEFVPCVSISFSRFLFPLYMSEDERLLERQLCRCAPCIYSLFEQ